MAEGTLLLISCFGCIYIWLLSTPAGIKDGYHLNVQFKGKEAKLERDCAWSIQGVKWKARIQALRRQSLCSWPCTDNLMENMKKWRKYREKIQEGIQKWGEMEAGCYWVLMKRTAGTSHQIYTERLFCERRCGPESARNSDKATGPGSFGDTSRHRLCIDMNTSLHPVLEWPRQDFTKTELTLKTYSHGPSLISGIMGNLSPPEHFISCILKSKETNSFQLLK